MDDGRLTDGKGRTVDFKNTVIIMTSNLGSAYLQSENIRSEDAFERASKQVMDALHGHFKPEFLNRVDDIIIFHPLGKEQLVKIIELRLEDLRRLLADRKISLELTDAAKDLLFTEGYDPNFGARPLKRAIQKLVQDPLALKILDGEVLHGDHVVVDADKKAGKMTFKVSERVGEKEEYLGALPNLTQSRGSGLRSEVGSATSVGLPRIRKTPRREHHRPRPRCRRRRPGSQPESPPLHRIPS